ncbi:HAD-IB family hydrolase [Ramlibacter sp.]|uniref:HAD family hydrolase n=1 Tax=Ramlibacter sp. TaxID=1917967 RepID=UPI0017AD4802|nr:HAD-IB family hydrolase [Ramlibacter sp.]MBA2676741.1 HAD-IB family hydrolase [Ramlibacter sp.]
MVAYAFFDVDGTLINTRSLISFLARLWALPGMDPVRFTRYWDGLRDRVRDGIAREHLNSYYFSVFQGLAVADVEAAGRAWFDAQSRKAGFYNAQGMALLRAQREVGLRVCLVTGSFPALVKPLADAIGVEAVLCSVPQSVEGRYTGQMQGMPCIGAHKADAIRAFALERGVDLARCIAFGDDASDQPMLDAVGQGVLVPTDARYAAEWQRTFAAPTAQGAIHG